MSQHEHLTLQENALAAAMMHQIGDMTIRYAIRDGIRYHDVPVIDQSNFEALAEDFGRDPKDSLAWARESLFAINRDPQLDKAEKDERLGRYLDAYTRLTVKLDHAAFPETRPGEVRKGVPEYLPDGFVDMGGDRSLDPSHRNRDMIRVDKAAVFERYKPVLKELFGMDLGEQGSDEQKKNILTFLAQKVFYEMPYAAADNFGGDVKNLSEMTDGVCRHKAMVFQVLAQAAGLKTTLSKVHVELDGRPPGRHAANLARVNGDWYLIDPTIPDYKTRNGRNEWRPGVMKAGPPPRDGETETFTGTMHYSGQHRRYVAHTNMYWHIAR